MKTISKKFYVQIEYCVPCDYSKYALIAATELINKFKYNINQLTLILGSNGIFDVKLDDELIFSKNESKRFPKTDELVNLLKEKIY